MKQTKELVEKESFYRQMNDLTKHHEGIYNGAVNDCMTLLDESPAIIERDIRSKAIHDTVAAIREHTNTETLYNRIIERLTELQMNASLEAASWRKLGRSHESEMTRCKTYANAIEITHEVAVECNVVTCDASEFVKKLTERFTAWVAKEVPANDDYDETKETICSTIYDAMSEIDEIAKGLNIPEYEEPEEERE